MTNNAEYYVKLYKIGWYRTDHMTHIFIPRIDDTIFEIDYHTNGRSWQELVLKAVGQYLRQGSMQPSEQ